PHVKDTEPAVAPRRCLRFLQPGAVRHGPPAPYAAGGFGQRLLTVLEESRRPDGTLVVGPGAELLAGGRVPEPGRLILTRGQDALAFRVEHRVVEAGRVPRQHAQFLAGQRVPQACRAVLARGQ